MATKPTDNITWAESADPGDVTEPSAKRAGGWQEGDPLAHNALNWTERAKGRWLTFFGAMFGNTGRLQMDAANGGLAVITDTATELTYELVHDSGTVAAKAALYLDRLLARRSVRLNVDTDAEADGDVQLVADNLTNNTCGVLTVGAKPGHATLTSSGLTAQVIRPSIASATDAGQRAKFPYDEALYQGNLTKLTAQIVIDYDGSGVPSITSSAGYNLDTATDPPSIDDPATVGGFSHWSLRLNMIDASQPGAVQATVAYEPGETLLPMICQSTPILTGARITLLWFNGTTFIDALATVALLAGETIVIHVTAT